MSHKHYPLIENNITSGDKEVLIEFLRNSDRLTHGSKVREFEKKWSEWLGVKYSVFVNSGSSANLLSMEILKLMTKSNPENPEVILPALTWISDISSVIRCGFRPVFADINLSNLSLSVEEIKSKITENTVGIFITHALGFNGLSEELLELASSRGIHLIEDACESHGAEFKNQKVGTFGLMSNFSFYYAHHISTIEGGMICTNDEEVYKYARMLRSHGLLRESGDDDYADIIIKENPNLFESFIFPIMGYNFRPNELNAVIGLNQIKCLDQNNEKRRSNFEIFLSGLDKKVYFTDFELEGSCNYSFVIMLREPNKSMMSQIEAKLKENKIEYRRGTIGGGNQLRQPYMKGVTDLPPEALPNTDHVHFNAMYIGNFPTLESSQITNLCEVLNQLASR